MKNIMHLFDYYRSIFHRCLLLAICLCGCTRQAAPPLSTASAVSTNIATTLTTATQDPTALSSGKPFRVDLEGKTWFLHCYGDGSPVVVLESGLGAGWSYWGNVIQGIKKETRVCAYERSYKSKTSREFAEDLHNLLASAGLQGPFILVGHSYGGLNVILYAHQYPEETAGILLEDIQEPGADARLFSALPPESTADSQDLKDLRNA